MTSHHPRTTLGAYAAAYVHHHHPQTSSANNNSSNPKAIELNDGRILQFNHHETEEEIHLRLKEEKRKIEEERLRKLRIETAKRRKKQEQMDAQLKEKKDLEIEKALQERKERIKSAIKLKNLPISKITTTTNQQRPYSEEGTKLPVLHKNEKRETAILPADITKKQIRHLNVLESLDLQGITSSTDMFLLAEKMANRESIRASEAYGALKGIERRSSTDECESSILSQQENLNILKVVSPSNKMKRVRIQVVEEKQAKNETEKEIKLGHLPNISQKRESPSQQDEIERKQASNSPPKEKTVVKDTKKKKTATSVPSTGVSIDIEKIEKDIVLIDKALLEKYQNLRQIDSSMLQRTGSNNSSYLSSTSSNTTSKKPKAAPKRAKPIFANRVRKF
ncbi:hypothetical protein C9374_000193 [Naegleria lovaniensis]|uniref:Uncharacterized protein n=1 Tax=Naegleria lovaniensis TaxID=51637 RepID=A0AA88GZB9_NAELO|nr:uncharacterized protein C9374_000193 [Naegleria lovaniensis]KAG2388754.1 hypothetical protein C9374_000193 [Naegleria lovaniensis]